MPPTVGRGQSIGCSYPILDLRVQVAGVPTDVAVLEFQIFDLTASPTQVYPVSGRQSLDTFQACPTGSKLSTGHYTAIWDVPFLSNVGTFRIDWYFKLDVTSTEQSFSYQFTVATAAASYESELVTRVRQFVHDAGVTPLYSTDVYLNAISRALARLNTDFGTTYTQDNLPARYENILEILAEIEMCYIRGGENASTDVSTSAGRVSQIAVPGLSATISQDRHSGPGYWLDLAKILEKRYEMAMEAIGATDPIATQAITFGHMVRLSRRTGGIAPYLMDVQLAAPSMSAAVDGSDVNISWTPIYSTNFSAYVIKRSAIITMATPTIIATIQDNHTIHYTDAPGIGTWYYQMASVNMNGLRADSEILKRIVV